MQFRTLCLSQQAHSRWVGRWGGLAEGAWPQLGDGAMPPQPILPLLFSRSCLLRMSIMVEYSLQEQEIDN